MNEITLIFNRIRRGENWIQNLNLIVSNPLPYEQKVFHDQMVAE